jgi:REP element-mobilizing transposase RayT
MAKNKHVGTSDRQLALRFRAGRGGARTGAGRKPKKGRDRHVSHRARPPHARAHPVHVTMRRARLLPSLRSQALVVEIEKSFWRASTQRYRVVHYSVQSDHVHLVVEAVDRTALSRGTQGLAIRLARAFNRVMGRRGKVWGDRFFARDLSSPREVRAGIVYVLMNHKKHAPAGRPVGLLDAYSSAAWFDGWSSRAGPLVVRLRAHLPSLSIPVVRPRTWLGRKGWRMRGLVDPAEKPADRRV